MASKNMCLIDYVILYEARVNLSEKRVWRIMPQSCMFRVRRLRNPVLYQLPSLLSTKYSVQNPPYKCIWIDQLCSMVAMRLEPDIFKVDVGCSPSQMILSELMLTLL